ncbi:MAG: amidohydrolase family protein [bacterium]|jgi:imidazolonepropionase-like amidohydrolase
MLALTNCCIITGDGVTLLEKASLLIDGERIAAINTGGQPPSSAEVLDLNGAFVLPGFINHHVHGTTFAPLFASGASALDRAEVVANQYKHLSAGTTTVLNVDGFALPDEVAEANGLTPLNVKTSACTTPCTLEAALAVDGKGLSAAHCSISLKDQVEAGAVAIGEAGSGHTLGGGGVDYMYIPERIKAETGRTISPSQARLLKEAVLGKNLQPDRTNAPALNKALTSAGLADRLTPERARELVAECVLPALAPARDSIAEAAAAAREFNLPLIAHTAPPSLQAVLSAARSGAKTIAAHTNHDSFTREEMLKAAQDLKATGAYIDGSTFDAFGARRTTESPDNLLTLLEAELVDFISTDYGGGFFDSLPLVLKAIVGLGILSLPQAVRLITSAPAKAIPGLAPQRGLLAPDYYADIAVLSRQDIARVLYVFVSGQAVTLPGK